MVVRTLLVILLIAVALNAVFTYHDEIHRFGNLTVVYSLLGKPATEVRVGDCIYYVVRAYDPNIMKAFNEAVKKMGQTDKLVEKWQIKFASEVWPVIDGELRAGNYSGPLDFDYCCGAEAEKVVAMKLSKISKWVNNTLTLAEKVEKVLRESGAEVKSVYVSVGQGYRGIVASTRPGKGASHLANIKNSLDNVFKSYRNIPLLVLIDIHETAPPSPYIESADDEVLRERFVKLYGITLQIYNNSGMSVKPGIEVLIGIGPGRGLIMMLKTPPNESRFLKTLTEMATREFGTCPNGTLIEFANEIRVESLIGVEIPWHLVILETVALVATASALIYLARRRIKELFHRLKTT